jgi:hypothetical protein
MRDAGLLPPQLEDLIMSEPTSGRRSRLTEPSSAAGLAALLALIVPSLADQAPVLVELGLSAIAAVAGILAIVQREGR